MIISRVCLNYLKIIELQHPRKARLSVFLWRGFKIYQAPLWKGKPDPTPCCYVKAHLLGKTMHCFVRVSFWSSGQAYVAGQEYEEFAQVLDVPFWAATHLQTPHAQLPLEPITAPQPEADLGSSSSFEESNARWLAGKKGKRWSRCVPTSLKSLLARAAVHSEELSSCGG